MDDFDLSHMGSPAPSREDPEGAPPGGAPGKVLSEAAQRALAEAADRRAEIDRRAAAITGQAEASGRGGLEPVRYQDWEIGGRAIDF
jgi:hypothetical protein